MKNYISAVFQNSITKQWRKPFFSHTLLLLLLSTAFFLQSLSQGFTTVDFHQAENDRAGNKTYDISWVNGILNATHTDYFEGMGVPQRIVFTGILPKPSGSPTARNTHSMIFQVLAEKASKHAYDFPISWEQAFRTATLIGNGTINELPHLLPGAGTQQCGDAFSAAGKAVCDALSVSNLPTGQIATPSFPDLIGNPGKPPLGAPNVNANITCFEGAAGYGDRTLEIRGNQAISNASISFDGYKGSGSDYAQYTITWTSTSDKIMIRFATRLSPGTGLCGYGSGQGAGSISGGPYHVVLNTLDGVSLGSQDNQIMSNAIQIPPNCSITGPTQACAGTQAVFSTTAVTGETYAWSMTSNTSGATPTSGSGASFTVTNVGSAGSFTVQLQVSGPSGVNTCTQTVTVNANPTVTVNSPEKCAAADAVAITATPSPSGTYSYAWTVPNGATAPGNVATFNTSVAGTYSVIITNTTTNCTGSGSGSLTVNPNPTVTVNSATKCPDGPAVTITATPGSGAATDYNYAWTVPPAATAPGNVQSFTTSVAGSYSVIITNKTTGCASPSGSGTLTVYDEPGKPAVVYNRPDCDATTFSLTVGSTLNPVIAGAIYTVTDKCGNPISGITPLNTGSTTQYTAPNASAITFSNIPTGSGYIVTVTNSNGCTSDPEACGTCPTPLSERSTQAAITQQTIINQQIDLPAQPTVAAAPNPFNDRVKFTLKSVISGQGALELYNMLGQKVKTVFQGYVQAGQVQNFEYSVPGAQRANLIYVFRVGDQRVTGQLIGLGK